MALRWMQRTLSDLCPPQAPGAQAQASAKESNFIEASVSFGGKAYPYLLYVPTAKDGELLTQRPLLVLLHGCKQDARDFSLGTGMNTLAQAQGCMVLYPEQVPKANQARCWNWFEPEHQQLDQGEPGMIAALIRQVLSVEYNGNRADPDRVYIAGLSAGGAMATVMAGLYPDIFAALGVHSGLPAGAAQDMLSAFTAMRKGAEGVKGQSAAMPTIVFHGTADTTVHPDNGEHITRDALDAFKTSGVLLEEQQDSDDTSGRKPERRTERRAYRSSEGRSYVEHWRISDGPHAWSGGDAAGSFTAPDGPSASAAMLAFFLQHRKSQRSK